MFCSNCGAQVNDQARFCRNCGTPVSNPSYTQPVPPAAPSEPPRTEPVKKDKYGRFSREWVIASGVLGIFFGYLGVHNFLMKQPVRGVLHILLIIVPFLPIALLFIDILSSGGISDLGIDFMPPTSDLTVWMSPGYFSWLWGVIEGIVLLATSRKYSSGKKRA